MADEPPPPEQPPKALPDTEAPKSKILKALSHPIAVVIGFISAVVGLIALPLSFYFFYAAKEYPQLTYYPHPVKATIVRAGEASRLSASFDNRPVETDITAAQVAIWNQGRRSIRRGQVLRPVVIYTENNTPILEATIRKSTRDVTQLSLNTDELQSGRVTVLWDILEQNDGGVIQLIYAGDANVQIKADGVIEGQPRLESLEFKGTIKTPYEQYESERRGYLNYGAVLIVLEVLLLLAIWGARVAKAKYVVASDIFLETLKSSSERRGEWIEWENKQIAKYEKYIASNEERIKKIEEHIAEMEEEIKGKEGPAAKEIADMFTQEISSYRKEQEYYRKEQEHYRKEQEHSRKKIQEYEGDKENRLSEIESEMHEDQIVKRKYDIITVALALLALANLVPVIYLLFIAEPIGPPFGF